MPPAPADSAPIPPDRPAARRVGRAYFSRWGVGLCLTDPQGRVIEAYRARGWEGPSHETVRRLAIDEALRWGEPAVQPGPDETVLWAVPVMVNARVAGGLVAGIAEARLFRRGSTAPVIDVRAACTDLRRLAEEHNLTNAALLELRRQAYRREQARAEAIHAYKANPFFQLRSTYLLDEPSLVAAIRKGDCHEARNILNRLLVAMIHHAGDRLELVKSLFMELVVTMSRTAVEGGGVPEELLGSRYDAIARLATIHDDEELASWLNEMLERIMDAIHAAPRHPHAAMLEHAMRIISERCCEKLTRDQVAEEAGMSRSHFSRMFRQHFGCNFSDVLLRLRTERAAKLLAETDRPLKIIALECGFTDQSHLTRVFRQHYRVPPAQYRREHKNTKD